MKSGHWMSFKGEAVPKVRCHYIFLKALSLVTGCLNCLDGTQRAGLDDTEGDCLSGLDWGEAVAFLSPCSPYLVALIRCTVTAPGSPACSSYGLHLFLGLVSSFSPLLLHTFLECLLWSLRHLSHGQDPVAPSTNWVKKHFLLSVLDLLLGTLIEAGVWYCFIGLRLIVLLLLAVRHLGCSLMTLLGSLTCCVASKPLMQLLLKSGV